MNSDNTSEKSTNADPYNPDECVKMNP